MHGELVAGVDEAGRGPLAGPVIAAAVILHPDRPIAGLADSKQLTQSSERNCLLKSHNTQLLGSSTCHRGRD